jgi:hypothetical protein
VPWKNSYAVALGRLRDQKTAKLVLKKSNARSDVGRQGWGRAGHQAEQQAPEQDSPSSSWALASVNSGGGISIPGQEGINCARETRCASSIRQRVGLSRCDDSRIGRRMSEDPRAAHKATGVAERMLAHHPIAHRIRDMRAQEFGRIQISLQISL